MLLYQPTPEEISDLMTRAAARWPQLGDRPKRAGEILLNGISPNPDLLRKKLFVQWDISSQERAGHYHTVIAQNCSCPDRPPLIRDNRRGPRRMCKHAIAVAAYYRIIRNHLNADIAAGLIDLSMMPNGHLDCSPAINVRNMGCCSVWRAGDDEGSTYNFVGDLSMVNYSVWLAKQQHAPQAFAEHTYHPATASRLNTQLANVLP